MLDVTPGSWLMGVLAPSWPAEHLLMLVIDAHRRRHEGAAVLNGHEIADGETVHPVKVLQRLESQRNDCPLN